MLPDNQELVIYFGHSSRTEFADSADFEDVAGLTQVYSGGIDVSNGPGWVTITLDTPFEYNGTDNLIIAVDENMVGYDDSGDDFYNSSVSANRSIYVFSDGTNPDATDPNNDQAGFLTRGTAAFVPNIIFDGIQQDCPNPTELAFSNVTTTGADFSWTVNGSETSWEVLVLEDGSEAPSNDTSGTTVSNDPMYTYNDGSPGTNYDFYVRANCGNGFSSWVGPLSFFTQCLAFDDLTENFDSTATGTTPECWSTIKITGDAFAAAQVVNFGASSVPNAYQLYNSGDAGANLILVSPNLTALTLDTHRVKFKASGSGYNLIVGTMSDPSDPDSFTEVESIILANGYQTYNVAFNNGTTDNFIAFKHGLGGTYRTIYIDDVIWEPIPTEPPACSEDVAATINESCGNFATTFSWSAVEGSDGYFFSLGTSPNSNDILDGVDLASALTYSFTGEANTTYYFTLIPYNDNGSATGCVEQSFTTYSDGCYCTSVPTSNDGTGITNVQLGATDFPNEDVTYTDNTSTEVELAQGLNANLQISFNTSFYDYNTRIWIDLNDNLTFEEEEIVYSGVSSSTNPNVLDASFVMPEDAAVGAHRMRIVATDALIDPANPCYSGSYGVTIDFTVSIVIATCTPPSVADAVVSPDCDNNQYYVDVEVADLGSGSPIIFDGTTEFPVASVGTVQVGPYENNTPVTLIIQHGTDSVCDLPIGTFNYLACPPANDECSGAESLFVNEDLECGTVTSSSVAGATPSGIDEDACFGAEDDDVWFSFVATNSAQRIQLSNVSNFADMFHSVWEGDCDNLTLLPNSCSDGDTSNPNGLQVGNTYYVRVNTYTATTGQSATFDICIGTPPPPPANDALCDAIAVVVGDETPGDAFSLISATGQAGENGGDCFNGGINGSTWFSFVAPESGEVTVTTDFTGGTLTDTEIAVYAAEGVDCNDFSTLGAAVGCDQDGGTIVNYNSVITFTGDTALTAGATYYVQVDRWASATEGTFGLRIIDLQLGTDTFDNASFKFYPNPVKDVLNLSYTQNITDVAVFNLIGQQVLVKTVNSNQGQVDMSSLSAGAYLVKVTSDNQVKTIKVVKQ